jgi:AraC family transcriptional regulator
MTIRQKKDSLRHQIEVMYETSPHVPSAASYRLGWKGLQALRYRGLSGSEISVPPLPLHLLVLITRPPEKLDLHYEGVKRDTPPPQGLIAVVPAESAVQWRWQGIKDSLHIYLEPSLVARVAAESFELDPTRLIVPPLDNLNAPELRAAMLAVDAELKAAGCGGPLMVEALATVLSVHLIRRITNPRRSAIDADGVLPRRKLNTVVEYIMENLENNPTLKQMAAINCGTIPSSPERRVEPGFYGC